MTDNAAFVSRLKRATVHRFGKMLLRTVREFQGRHSIVPTTPILANDTFPWTALLEQQWETIRAEFDSVWTRPEDIPSFHQISPDQTRISKGDNWKTYGLYLFGQAIEPNATMCAHTRSILTRIPGLQNAWFSILAPGYHIPPHRGPTRALIRAHLGLKVPADRSACWLRVDEEICTWQEGRCLLFDDTYEHEVRNDTTEYRAVLFLDIDRPMDAVGQFTNRMLLKLMQASHYVKDPIKNLNAWNRRLARRQSSPDG